MASRFRVLLPILIFFAAVVLPARAQFGPGTSRGPSNITVDAGRFGAAPNDNLDDDASIQAALSAVQAAGGGTVTVSQPGIYWLNSPTVAPNTTYNSSLLIGSNTRLVAVEGVIFKLRPEAVCYMIRNSSPTALITTVDEMVAPTANTNISIEGGVWDANAVFVNATDAVIASDGVTVTSSSFNGYSYTSGDAAYIWWAAPAATITGASVSGTTLTSSGNFTGVVTDGGTSRYQIARLYSGSGTTLGNYNITGSTANTITLSGSPGGSAISLDLFPPIGSTNISSTNGTNSITLASSVGVSKTSNGFTNARITVSTQNATPNPAFGRWLGHAMAFSGVDRLSIKSLKIQNCSKYAVLAANVTNGYFDSIYINNRKQGADGLHFNGPCRGLVITNVRGITDDNLLGFTTSEGTYFSGGSPQTGATTAAALDGNGRRVLTKTGAFSASDLGKYVQITGGTGVTTGLYQIAVVNNANDVALATDPGGSGSSVAFYTNGYAVTDFGEGNINDVLIDGIYGDNDSVLGPGYELVRLVGKSGQVFKNFKILNISGYVRKGAAVKLADDGNGQLNGAVMRDILIDGVNVGSEYGEVYITGTGVKDVTCRNVWAKEAVLLTLTGVSTPGGSSDPSSGLVTTSTGQTHPYNGVGLVSNGFTSADQLVFTSGPNKGGRFFIRNDASGNGAAPNSSTTLYVYSTFPAAGSNQTAEIRRTPGVVWVGTGVVLDSLTLRDCGSLDASNALYTGYLGIDGTVKSLVVDGLPMILGNGGIGINISGTGIINYGVLSRIYSTDNGSGNSYSIYAKNTSTRSYLTISESNFVSTGAVLRGIYATGLLDVNLDGLRFGGNANLRPFETAGSGDLNLYGGGITYGPTMPSNPFTISAGSLRSNSQDVLLSSTSVTINNATGTNTLLTPASGKTAVISKIILTVTAISSPSGTPSVSAGITGAGYTDVVGTSSLANFATVGSVASFMGKADVVVTNAAPLTLNKSSALASGTLTVQVDVYGFLR